MIHPISYDICFHNQFSVGFAILCKKVFIKKVIKICDHNNCIQLKQYLEYSKKVYLLRYMGIINN